MSHTKTYIIITDLEKKTSQIVDTRNKNEALIEYMILFFSDSEKEDVEDLVAEETDWQNSSRDLPQELVEYGFGHINVTESSIISKTQAIEKEKVSDSNAPDATSDELDKEVERQIAKEVERQIAKAKSKVFKMAYDSKKEALQYLAACFYEAEKYKTACELKDGLIGIYSIEYRIDLTIAQVILKDEK